MGVLIQTLVGRFVVWFWASGLHWVFVGSSSLGCLGLGCCDWECLVFGVIVDLLIVLGIS